MCVGVCVSMQNRQCLVKIASRVLDVEYELYGISVSFQLWRLTLPFGVTKVEQHVKVIFIIHSVFTISEPHQVCERSVRDAR